MPQRTKALAAGSRANRLMIRQIKMRIMEDNTYVTQKEQLKIALPSALLPWKCGIEPLFEFSRVLGAVRFWGDGEVCPSTHA